jgi:hypothetical protein
LNGFFHGSFHTAGELELAGADRGADLQAIQPHRSVPALIPPLYFIQLKYVLTIACLILENSPFLK